MIKAFLNRAIIGRVWQEKNKMTACKESTTIHFKNSINSPAASITSQTARLLWVQQLSITITLCGPGLGVTQGSCIFISKNSNARMELSHQIIDNEVKKFLSIYWTFDNMYTNIPFNCQHRKMLYYTPLSNETWSTASSPNVDCPYLQMKVLRSLLDSSRTTICSAIYVLRKSYIHWAHNWSSRSIAALCMTFWDKPRSCKLSWRAVIEIWTMWKRASQLPISSRNKSELFSISSCSSSITFPESMWCLP